MQLTEETIRQSRRSKSDRVADKPQLVELVIDGRFFFDIKVRGRNVSLGLIIVVIRDEIFHRVVRKEALEFVVKLGRQGFVVRHHNRGPVGLLNHLGHGVGLARSGHAQ